MDDGVLNRGVKRQAGAEVATGQNIIWVGLGIMKQFYQSANGYCAP